MDQIIRMEVFRFLEEKVKLHDDGFYFQDKRVPLLGPQGIWKPAILEKYPISITSVPEGPYDDSFSDDSTLHYKYRGVDPNHRDNIGLKLAMQDQIPLVFSQNKLYS
jgi:putative restriction endonuclease